ncbi:MAG: putative spermidine/putrescine transport system permease protein [Desulforhopalus sp.]|jgi:putative spermidine/putrescine transport system permease protein
MNEMTRGQRPLLLLILFTVSLPFVPLLLWSCSEQWFYPAILPQKFGLRAWHYIFSITGKQIIGGLVASFSVASATSLISLLLGIPAGRALGLYNFSGKKFVSLILLLPIVVPPLSTSMGLHFWFLQLNLTETFMGVVIVHLTFCLPYTILVIWGVFTDFNTDFEEQARSLGASPIQTMVRVTLPMILPGVTVAALFSFLLSWSQYLCTLIIGGGKILTLPILLFSMMDAGDRPVAAAVSLIFIIPVMLVLLASAHNLGRHGFKGIR